MKVPDTLPWEHDSDAGFIRSGYTVICQFWNKTENDFGNEDINAEYIVHACNLYPELIEVLEDLLNSYSGKDKICGHDFICICPSERAIELLKRAKS